MKRILLVLSGLICSLALSGQDIYPSNKTISTLEKNLLFNANKRLTVTQTGSAVLDLNELFNGSFTPSYTATGIVDSTVVIIEGITPYHTQAAAWIGWSTRAWAPTKFKIQVYNTYPNTPPGIPQNAWSTIIDTTGYSKQDFLIRIPNSIPSKVKFVFYTASGTSGRLGISELFLIHPEAGQAYDNLLVKYDKNLNVVLGTPLSTPDSTRGDLAIYARDAPDNRASLKIGYDASNNLEIYRDRALPDIYFKANQASTGHMRFVTNNSNFTFNGGKVGIGVTTPAYPLQVLGHVAMGSTVTGSTGNLIILGPNSPANSSNKRDISFEFSSAGKAQIRSYRGNSWDTFLQFLTTPYAGGNPVERLHIAGDGKIGVGTINPAYRLDVNGDLRINKGSALRFFRGDSATNGLNIYSATSNNFIHAQNGGLIQISTAAISLDATSGHNFRNVDGTTTYMAITSTGNVGIGVNAPTKRLELGGSQPISLDPASGTVKMKASTGGWTMNYGFKGSSDTDWGGLWAYGSADALTYWSIGKVYTDNFLVVKNNGQIGIGTSSIPTDYKLAVAGNVIAEKIKVKKQVGGVWPDYVFSPDYKLPGLDEVEIFTKKNSHLPEIPSAKEIEKDGQDLGEMNRLLLKKVEELTLYVIDLKKELNKQNTEIQKLKNK